MASAGASSCCRAILRLELTGRSIGAKASSGTRLGQARNIGTLCRNETWCRRWWNISRKSLSTGTRMFTPSLSPMLSKEQQHFKEARETRDAPKDARESKETKSTTKESKEAKDSKKAKDKTTAITIPEVVVEYQRGLPRITLPLPSKKEKCMFTLKPITQTVGDFLDLIKQEDPGVTEASITTIDGIKMGASNRIETLLMDDFKLVINGKIYPVSPPMHIAQPKENLRQLRDLQALVSQLYETFNAREYHAELERDIMLQLEEVKIELEPLEQMRMEIEKAAARRSYLASWGVLVMMSIQFGCLARLTWWEYSWDIMEPVTYFVTYATAMGCYIYFLMTRQEYMLPEVFNREHLIGLHRKAKKVGFDLQRYNILKDEAYELETMLKIIRGPLHIHQCAVELKRRERFEKYHKDTSGAEGGSSSSSSSSSSRSPSSSPSPSPERERARKEEATMAASRSKEEKHGGGTGKKAPHPTAVITN